MNTKNTNINISSQGVDISTPGPADMPGVPQDLRNNAEQPGVAEFAALKDDSGIDLGSIKSRDLGNMLSGELVRLGEVVAKAKNPDVDFGNLPSRSLTEMGKDVLKSE